MQEKRYSIATSTGVTSSLSCTNPSRCSPRNVCTTTFCFVLFSIGYIKFFVYLCDFKNLCDSNEIDGR